MENKENITVTPENEDDVIENEASETEVVENVNKNEQLSSPLTEEDVKEEEHIAYEAIEDKKVTEVVVSENDEDIKEETPLFINEDYVDIKEYPSLLDNPFLYNLDNSSNVQVKTIEEFAIKYKKDYVYLGSVTHNDNIDKKLKLKLVKKAFKKWKQNFYDNYLDAIGNVSSAVETMEVTPVKTVGGKFKVTLFIFMLFELIPILMLINSVLKLITVDLILNGSINMMDMFNSQVFTKLGVLLPIISLVLMIVLGLIYKIRSHKFKKLKKKAEKFSKRSSKEIKKCFKKVYKNAYEYYLSNIKSDDLYYEPLAIDEVICNKCDVTEIEELILDAANNAATQRKRRNIMSIINKILLALFIIGVIISLVFCAIAMFV